MLCEIRIYKLNFKILNKYLIEIKNKLKKLRCMYKSLLAEFCKILLSENHYGKIAMYV